MKVKMADLNLNNGAKRYLSLCFVILLGSLSISAAEFSIDGYYKNFFVAFHQSDYLMPFFDEQTADMGAVNNRLRLEGFLRPTPFLSFHLAYDFSPRIQDPWLFNHEMVGNGIDPYSYRIIDVDRHLYPSKNKKAGSFGIFHNIDRLQVTLKTKPADIIFGRQAVAWGSARVVNPTDVIAPFAFQELDTEDPIGVDALRIRAPLGNLGEFDAGFIFGKNLQSRQSAFIIRNKVNIAKTDVALLLLKFRRHLLVGVDVARNIGEAGFWLEGAYVMAEMMSPWHYPPGGAYFRSSMGFDYSFNSKLYGFIEYHFSDAGAVKPEAYLHNLSKPAFTDGSVYLMGRHYLAPGCSFQMTPLIVLNTVAMVNVIDRSAFITPQLEYNIAQDIYIALGAFFSVGSRPDITNALLNVEPRINSEFGSYPDIYFTAFRIYF